jgi:hypothetical protein
MWACQMQIGHFIKPQIIDVGKQSSETQEKHVTIFRL